MGQKRNSLSFSDEAIHNGLQHVTLGVDRSESVSKVVAEGVG